MADSIIESPLVTTIKASDDRDSPWVVIRSKDAQQLQSQLQELENGTVFADIGRVAAVFQAQARLGAQLGAKGLDPHQATGAFEGVTAATTTSTAPTETPPAATTPPPAAPAKFPAFGGFKMPASAPAPSATPPPSAPAREASEPPAAAPAANGFPAAPAWKRP
jgi:hypothetical protein